MYILFYLGQLRRGGYLCHWLSTTE